MALTSYGAGVEFIPPEGGNSVAALVSGLLAGGHVKPVGIAAVRAVKDHLVAKERGDPHKSANALGANPSGLYADMADSTTFLPQPDGVDLQISHVAARQRIEGGDIFPVNCSFLTIPARREAYGKRAATVGVPLRFGYAFDSERSRWRKALIADAGGTRKVKDRRKGRDGQTRDVADKSKPAGIYFWLVRSVRQKPDPTVLPDDENFFGAVFAALDGYVEGMG